LKSKAYHLKEHPSISQNMNIEHDWKKREFNNGLLKIA